MTDSALTALFHDYRMMWAGSTLPVGPNLNVQFTSNLNEPSTRTPALYMYVYTNTINMTCILLSFLPITSPMPAGVLWCASLFSIASRVTKWTFHLKTTRNISPGHSRSWQSSSKPSLMLALVTLSETIYKHFRLFMFV